MICTDQCMVLPIHGGRVAKHFAATLDRGSEYTLQPVNISEIYFLESIQSPAQRD